MGAPPGPKILPVFKVNIAGGFSTFQHLPLDIAAMIASGAYPLTPETPAVAATTVNFTQVGAGRVRIVVTAAGWIEGTAAILAITVTRNGVIHLVTLGEPCDVDAIAPEDQSTVNLKRPILLQRGDIMSVTDLAASGNDVTASIWYAEANP